MELLERTWYGVSSEKLDELRQHIVVLRTSALLPESACGRDTETGPRLAVTAVKGLRANVRRREEFC
jgi:hypothetical protein